MFFCPCRLKLHVDGETRVLPSVCAFLSGCLPSWSPTPFSPLLSNIRAAASQSFSFLQSLSSSYPLSSLWSSRCALCGPLLIVTWCSRAGRTNVIQTDVTKETQTTCTSKLENFLHDTQATDARLKGLRKHYFLVKQQKQLKHAANVKSYWWYLYRERRRRAVQLLTTVLIIFTICFTPFHIRQVSEFPVWHISTSIQYLIFNGFFFEKVPTLHREKMDPKKFNVTSDFMCRRFILIMTRRLFKQHHHHLQT